MLLHYVATFQHRGLCKTSNMKTALLWDIKLCILLDGKLFWCFGGSTAFFTVLEPQIFWPVICFQKMYEISHYKVHFPFELV